MLSHLELEDKRENDFTQSSRTLSHWGCSHWNTAAWAAPGDPAVTSHPCLYVLSKTANVTLLCHHPHRPRDCYHRSGCWFCQCHRHKQKPRKGLLLSSSLPSPPPNGCQLVRDSAKYILQSSNNCSCCSGLALSPGSPQLRSSLWGQLCSSPGCPKPSEGLQHLISSVSPHSLTQTVGLLFLIRLQKAIGPNLACWGVGVMINYSSIVSFPLISSQNTPTSPGSQNKSSYIYPTP